MKTEVVVGKLQETIGDLTEMQKIDHHMELRIGTMKHQEQAGFMVKEKLHILESEVSLYYGPQFVLLFGFFVFVIFVVVFVCLFVVFVCVLGGGILRCEGLVGVHVRSQVGG